MPDPAASTMSGPLLPPHSPEKVPLPVSWGQRKLKASCDLGGEAREGPSRQEGHHMLQACLSWLTDTQTDTRTQWSSSLTRTSLPWRPGLEAAAPRGHRGNGHFGAQAGGATQG